MQKITKNVFKILLVIILCFSTVTSTAFAVGWTTESSMIHSNYGVPASQGDVDIFASITSKKKLISGTGVVAYQIKGTTKKEYGAHNLSIEVAVIDPSKSNVEFGVWSKKKTSNPEKWELKRATTVALEQSKAKNKNVIAVNANFFLIDEPSSKPQGFAATNGKSLFDSIESGHKEFGKYFAINKNKKAVIGHNIGRGQTVSAHNLDCAVSTHEGSVLLYKDENGIANYYDTKPTEGVGKEKRTSRTAVGIRNNGQIVIVTVDCNDNETTGLYMDEKKDKKTGSSIHHRELGILMYSLGCKQALSLDGGRSVQMAYIQKGGKSAIDVATPKDFKVKKRSVPTIFYVAF